uniref:Uncharacterized protein n=1 Tax=Arundo donax TaxID=35708 RepID=A0A0A9CV60_ARUDO
MYAYGDVQLIRGWFHQLYRIRTVSSKGEIKRISMERGTITLSVDAC